MNRILAWFLIALIFAMSGPLQAATMASARGFEKSLYGRSAPWADKYAYCNGDPIGKSDPSGLEPSPGEMDRRLRIYGGRAPDRMVREPWLAHPAGYHLTKAQIISVTGDGGLEDISARVVGDLLLGKATGSLLSSGARAAAAGSEPALIPRYTLNAGQFDGLGVSQVTGTMDAIGGEAITHVGEVVGSKVNWPGFFGKLEETARGMGATSMKLEYTPINQQIFRLTDVAAKRWGYTVQHIPNGGVGRFVLTKNL